MTSSTDIQFKPAERIASFKPYYFAALNQKLAELKKKGMSIIRLDIGSPDLPPADFIIEALEKSARRADTHGYTPNGGNPAFRQAIAHYYQTRFSVTLDPQKEVLGLIGSKEGLFNLSQVLINPGDISLVPDPGYPVYSASGIIAGGEIYPLPVRQETGYLPDLNSIPGEVLKRARILWLNYPNNPTGAVAPFSFLEKAVEFGRKHRILIAHDAPYADVCFDGYKAPSILQVPGAKEICIEFNSLSKAYNMAGWRLGMAVGNQQIINFLSIYKSQIDTSHFQAVLDAGTVALTGDQTWLEERNQIYQYRRDIILKGLRAAGFNPDTPAAAIYIWVRLPEPFTDSTEFCNRLLEEAGVSVTPGVIYGQFGEGYIRISLGTPTDQIKIAMQRFETWMKETRSK